LPLVLDGASVKALVVGGGSVATRKVTALRDDGASVRVRALEIGPELTTRAAGDERLHIERAPYDEAAIADAALVVAATDDPAVNARVARDARRQGRLTIVVDDPALGNCVMPAVHRSGELLVAVASGGVPGASVRVRDALAQRLDGRYAAAIRDLVRLRQRLLGERDRAAWQSAARALIADDFCESVESGEFSERLAEWR
jgi:precorrin-2 dehydrogenase / sirohydrochlorin ferrochelatase